MSESQRRFCETISSLLDEMEARLRHIRESVAGSAIHVSRTVQANLDEAIHRVELRNGKFQQERAQVKSKIKQDLAREETSISKWKTSRDVRNLSSHAQNAEYYAVAAILEACDAIDEAEVAALRALDARMTADALPFSAAVQRNRTD